MGEIVDKTKLAIGVFDSGMGGLTVLRALRYHLPHENFVYLGDTARLPYGTKSPETVKQYATQMTRILIEKQIKALVIACNTATTAALEHLQNLYPDLPVIGVVNPGALAASQASQNGEILVLATETTISSRAYHQAISKLLPSAKIEGRACSLLVALAEEGIVEHDIARLTIQHYLPQDVYYDTILLGCTHFPVFRPLLEEMIPQVKVVDSATATAKSLEAALRKHGLLHHQALPQSSYLVTDAINRFCRIGEIFLGEEIPPANVTLIDAN